MMRLEEIRRRVEDIDRVREHELDVVRRGYLDEMEERVQECLEEGNMAEAVHAALMTVNPTFVECEPVEMADRCVMLRAFGEVTDDVPETLLHACRLQDLHVVTGHVVYGDNIFVLFKFQPLCPKHTYSLDI